MVLMGYSGARGTLIYEKNLMSKISCQTPFKNFSRRRANKALRNLLENFFKTQSEALGTRNKEGKIKHYP